MNNYPNFWFRKKPNKTAAGSTFPTNLAGKVKNKDMGWYLHKIRQFG